MEEFQDILFFRVNTQFFPFLVLGFHVLMSPHGLALISNMSYYLQTIWLLKLHFFAAHLKN